MTHFHPKRMRRLRRLSTVPRWTVIPTIQRQNVAEHSFHVLTLALWLAEYNADWRSGSIDHEKFVSTVLFHDESEAITGDIAAPAKGVVGDSLKAFEKGNDFLQPVGQTKTILKCADLLEAWLFLVSEIAMGNSSVAPVIDDIKVNFGNAWNSFLWVQGGADLNGHYHQYKPPFWSVLDTVGDMFDHRTHPAMEGLSEA